LLALPRGFQRGTVQYFRCPPKACPFENVFPHEQTTLPPPDLEATFTFGGLLVPGTLNDDLRAPGTRMLLLGGGTNNDTYEELGVDVEVDIDDL